LLRDLKIAIRHLSKSPGFSITSVFMLALGIGATTAIFSIVEGVLLRPLPFPDPGHLVVLADELHGADLGGYAVTGPDIVNYSRDTHSFTALGGYQQFGHELSGAGEPAQINDARMTAGVFAALEVEPLLGRVFTQQEDDQKQRVAVLSYATWQSRFHGDSGILGQKILLDRKPYVVIGVMPRNFEFPLIPGHLNRSELWIPMSFQPEELTGGAQASWGFQMAGRLKPGVTPALAREDADRVARETMRSYPAFMAGLRITSVVHDLHEDTIAKARPLVRTLFLAVAVVLLIACANLAGLLLVRAIRRRREIAFRLALGSSAATLLRQALLESLVLSVTGGVIGLVAAAIALRVGTNLLPETLPLIGNIGLDWPVAAFALSLAVVTGVVSGVAPAFAAIRTSVNETLKEGAAPAPPAEDTRASAPVWLSLKLPSLSSFSPPPACCCAASKKCAKLTSAIARTTPSSQTTTSRASSTAPRPPSISSIRNCCVVSRPFPAPPAPASLPSCPPMEHSATKPS
jgi:predicted permease